MKPRRELPIPEPGDIVASGEVDGEEREYSVQAIAIQPSMNEWPGQMAGSVAAGWTSAGYEICVRVKGGHWRSKKIRSTSMLELLSVLAEDLEIPDKALRHPRAIELRRQIRQEQKRELGWEG